MALTERQARKKSCLIEREFEREGRKIIGVE